MKVLEIWGAAEVIDAPSRCFRSPLLEAAGDCVCFGFGLFSIRLIMLHLLLLPLLYHQLLS